MTEREPEVDFSEEEDAPLEIVKDEIVGEDDDGEDLMENMQDDYKTIDMLDHYDEEGIDQRRFKNMQADNRFAAEAEIRKRRRDEAIERGDTRALDLMTPEEEYMEPKARRRRLTGDDDVDEEPAALEDYEGPVKELLLNEGPRSEVSRQFREFLLTMVDDKGNSVYGDRINQMCTANRQSLEVEYNHLTQKVPRLGFWLPDAPRELLDIFNEVALDAVLQEFPNYGRIHNKIYVRITGLPLADHLRELRHIHLDALVKVAGVVTYRSKVFPSLKVVKFSCPKCKTDIGPFTVIDNRAPKVQACPNCQRSGPFTINEKETTYGNHQRITLQEAPGTVPSGRLPRSKEVILEADLADSVAPGDEIEVTGIYHNAWSLSSNVKQGFPVFTTVINANSISKKREKFACHNLSEDDEKTIRELAQLPNIKARILASIAPSIYGHQSTKEAIALTMFGGVAKEVAGKTRLRGDINVLMVGDPGTAKSQFLKYVEKTVPRAVFATGQGASGVGLTAAVCKDPVSHEWSLQGGAMVLADQGFCMIDEFDKMNDQDRTSIHEAMEQQSISISKAGIVTTLQARCSVVSAANPVNGRYESGMTFKENVDLSEPILSRFDVLCVIRDNVDTEADERLARFVVNSHLAAHPNNSDLTAEERDSIRGTLNERVEGDAEPLPQDILRKYIMYARERVSPKLYDLPEAKISTLYSDLREFCKNTSSLPVTVRWVESVVRLTEASARLHLRDQVNDEDVNFAVKVALEGFISAQKHAVSQRMRKHFRRFLTYDSDSNDLLLHTLKTLLNEICRYEVYRTGETPEKVVLDLEEFKTRALELEVSDIGTFLNSRQFTAAGFVLDGQSIVYHFTDDK